jgi:hypothetical protein
VDPATGKATIDGEQALGGIASLYDWGGSVVAQLNSLIDAVLASRAEKERKHAR